MSLKAQPDPDFASSIFSNKTNTRLPDDTLFYSIFPDSALSATTTTTATISEQLHALHLQILEAITPFTSSYIWQHQPFTLSPVTSTTPHHLHGSLRYGDNLEDEWFAIFLLFHISSRFPGLSIKLWDTDGEVLLIETAFHLPRWLNPETSSNRVFIRHGCLHIIPVSCFPANTTPPLLSALKSLVSDSDANCTSRAPDKVQEIINKKIQEYPDRAFKNMHHVRVRVPVSVAQVLRHEPCLIALAVEGFYDRDIDTMKFAAKMERFLKKGKEEELVEVVVKMSRAMYAQLMQQAFQPPKCYPGMPPRSDIEAYKEAELGMKIACGFEMIYQLRKRQGTEGKGRTWEAFKESLENSGYFEGLLPGSKEYKRLMMNAEEYYKNSSLHSRASEMLSAPVKRIDEILTVPLSADDFKSQALPPSDDDSWLYGGEDELNAALEERQKEMELYNMKHKKKQKAKDQQDEGQSSGKNIEDYNLSDIAKSMQAFVKKMSSYKGAEVPENRKQKDVDFDVDLFMKDMESVLRRQDSEGAGSDIDLEEGSLSDMDFDESDDSSDSAEPSENNDEEGNLFMDSYSEALSKELKATTLDRSFVRASQERTKKDEGPSVVTDDMEEEFTPVDVDVNLVKNFLDSFSSQEGLPGPASNLLGLMGLQLPPDASKGK